MFGPKSSAVGSLDPFPLLLLDFLKIDLLNLNLCLKTLLYYYNLYHAGINDNLFLFILVFTILL